MAVYSCPVNGLGATKKKFMPEFEDPIVGAQNTAAYKLPRYRGSNYCFPVEELEYGYQGHALTLKDLQRLRKNNLESGRKAEIRMDWPVRLETGISYLCNMCGRGFKMYMALTEEWEKLPTLLWGHRLCLDCYKTYVWMRGKAPAGFRPEEAHLIRLANQWGIVNMYRTVVYERWLQDHPEESPYYRAAQRKKRK